jgi:two-component system OmpR family response regulator
VGKTACVRVLLVDDEVRAVAALARGLGADGFTVDVVHDGPSALDAALARHYDAIVLDIMLPGMSGYEVLKRLRAGDVRTAVLMLSAKDGDYDLADAFELGADDYLVKPFGYVVLVARLRALARRGRDQTTGSLSVGDLTMDPVGRSVHLSGELIDLTPRELRLLEHLMRANGRVVSKSDLLEEVFEADPDSHPNVVEVYVGYLRRKLGRGWVTTVRGGYRIGTG